MWLCVLVLWLLVWVLVGAHLLLPTLHWVTACGRVLYVVLCAAGWLRCPVEVGCCVVLCCGGRRVTHSTRPAPAIAAIAPGLRRQAAVM